MLTQIQQCLVLGKDAKDVPRERALEYVGGWTVGNDFSARKLQLRPELAGMIMHDLNRSEDDFWLTNTSN